jgi:hypothetical protein
MSWPSASKTAAVSGWSVSAKAFSGAPGIASKRPPKRK